MKKLVSTGIVIIPLSVASILLYFGAGFIVSFVMEIITRLLGDTHAFFMLLGVGAFGLIVASATYGFYALYKGSPGRFLVWSTATIGSIIIGLLFFSSLIRFWPLLLDNHVLFLVMSSLVGTLVGSIQWLVFRDRVKRGYLWIFAMALCWLFWGNLLFLLIPTFD